jgi:hypothetical protein
MRPRRIAVAIGAVLAVAGVLAGNPQARRPSVDVTELELADAGSPPPPCTTSGDFRIINTTGDGAVTPEEFIPGMEFIGPRGVRTPCANVIFTLLSAGQPGGEIPTGDFASIAYEMRCAGGCPANTREVKNYIWVKIFGRDKLFFNSGGWTY